MKVPQFKTATEAIQWAKEHNLSLAPGQKEFIDCQESIQSVMANEPKPMAKLLGKIIFLLGWIGKILVWLIGSAIQLFGILSMVIASGLGVIFCIIATVFAFMIICVAFML